MAQEQQPEVLFRVFGRVSNGDNSPEYFAPACKARQIDNSNAFASNKPQPLTGAQLKMLLLDKHVPDAQVIFFASSLLFDLQLAARMRAQGSKDLKIVCIYAKTARTSDGKPVVFQSVKSLMEKLDVRLTNRGDGAVREYPIEYAVTSDVVPGPGSFYVSFQDLLDNGLYMLYPELEGVNKRHNVKLHRAVEQLRAFSFSKERALSKEKITVAKNLIARVKSCDADASLPDDSPVVSHLLALQKRDSHDLELRKWISVNPKTGQVDEGKGIIAALPRKMNTGLYNSARHPMPRSPPIRETNARGNTIKKQKATACESGDDSEGEHMSKSTTLNPGTVTTPELDQYLTLHAILKDRVFANDSKKSTVKIKIPSSELAADQAEWEHWSKKQHEECRAARAANGGYQRRERRGNRSQGLRSVGDGSRVSKHQRYARGSRSDRPRS